jgi:hypothetical protein
MATASFEKILCKVEFFFCVRLTSGDKLETYWLGLVVVGKRQ